MIDLDEMKFNNFMEFTKKRKLLRVYYILLTYDEKREYKKYIYSLEFKDFFKDKLWEYLNEPKGSPYYVYEWEIMEFIKYYARNKNLFELFF